MSVPRSSSRAASRRRTSTVPRGGHSGPRQVSGRGQCAARLGLPHPDGLFDPITFVDEIDELSHAEQAKIMGGKLTRLMKAVE
jgi:hypothetical protein